MGMNNGRKNGERAFLDRFDQYEKICIQCHDNPDADALASVMRCGVFLKKREKKLLSSMVEQIRSKIKFVIDDQRIRDSGTICDRITGL